jgi:hypothetical protein
MRQHLREELVAKKLAGAGMRCAVAISRRPLVIAEFAIIALGGI